MRGNSPHRHSEVGIVVLTCLVVGQLALQHVVETNQRMSNPKPQERLTMQLVIYQKNEAAHPSHGHFEYLLVGVGEFGKVASSWNSSSGDYLTRSTIRFLDS